MNQYKHDAICDTTYVQSKARIIHTSGCGYHRLRYNLTTEYAWDWTSTAGSQGGAPSTAPLAYFGTQRFLLRNKFTSSFSTSSEWEISSSSTWLRVASFICRFVRLGGCSRYSTGLGSRSRSIFTWQPGVDHNRSRFLIEADPGAKQISSYPNGSIQ